MKKELRYFWIGNSYGGNQDWFTSFMMRIGGCAAQTACDSCVYFAKRFGMIHLYPYETSKVKKEEYIQFSNIMKPFLRPRIGGVSKLEWYVQGFLNYLETVGESSLSMTMLSGERPFFEAKDTIKRQIDQGIPVPCLLLKHKNPSLEDYTWHWFLIIGYDGFEDGQKPMVKAVSYSRAKWLPFDMLWETGYEQKGGLIVYHIE